MARRTTADAEGQEIFVAKDAGPLARRLAELMLHAGLSPRALSLKANMSPDGVRNILRGKSSHPRSDTLHALAKALGVPVIVLADPESPIQTPTPSLERPLEDAAHRMLSIPELSARDLASWDIKDGAAVPRRPWPSRAPRWRIPAAALDDTAFLDTDALIVVATRKSDIARVIADTSNLRLSTRTDATFLVLDGPDPAVARIRGLPDGKLTMNLYGETIDGPVPDVPLVGRVVASLLLA